MVGACWGCFATTQQEMENTASSMGKAQQYLQVWPRGRVP